MHQQAGHASKKPWTERMQLIRLAAAGSPGRGRRRAAERYRLVDFLRVVATGFLVSTARMIGVMSRASSYQNTDLLSSLSTVWGSLGSTGSPLNRSTRLMRFALA